MLEILYNKRNSLVAKTESETYSSKMKTCISSTSIFFSIFILVKKCQNFHERKDTHLSNIPEMQVFAK